MKFVVIFLFKVQKLNQLMHERILCNSTDEYPILFVIAALTKGVSIFKGIKDLKNKESDRIKEMQSFASNKY